MSKLPAVIIGIDVETTSLDPKTGQIIEVAAIKYEFTLKGQFKELAEFSRLTSPSQPLSSEITAITGITPDMVQGKPKFAEYIDELQAFIGDHLLFAHNAPFDITWLSYHGLKLDNNKVWDTFALASTAWPNSPSYNLGTLSQQLNIEIDGEHRAGDDVRLTSQLLMKAIGTLTASSSTLSEINSILYRSEQSHYMPLFSQWKPVNSQAKSKQVKSKGNFKSPKPKSISATLGPKGLLDKSQSHFTSRPQQVDMAKTIEGAFAKPEHALIEAPPGTGKTLAYLVPSLNAILKKRQSGQLGPAVVISTYTKHLQDQITSHDLPQLTAALDISVDVRVLKGRRNYLCTARLEKMLARPSYRPDEAFVLIKLLIWLESGPSGDLEHINLSHQALEVTSHLHADSLSCRTICAKERPRRCPYQVAKAAATQAELVIINHALLINRQGEEATFGAEHLIIDEAHHLVDTARAVSQIDFTSYRVAEIIAPLVQLARKSGKINPQLKAEGEQLIKDYQQFLYASADYVAGHSSSDQLLLNSSTRRSTSWQKVQQFGLAWEGKLNFLIGLTKSKASDKDSPGLTEAIAEAEQFSRQLNRLLVGGDDRIQWLAIPFNPVPDTEAKRAVEIHDVALSILPQLDSIYQHVSSVIFTSATLAIGGNYDYIKRQLGLTKGVFTEQKIDSPFDYQNHMLIYIVDDGLEPSDLTYDQFTAQQMGQVARTTGGRLLTLFTSHRSLKGVYYESLKELNKGTYKILAQGLTGGRHNIAERFKQTPQSILLGAGSFWEGLDVPGENLSIVLIPKLPFDPPNDPVTIRLSEVEGKSAFSDIAIPRMILKLRQGIGRLLRHQNDHGAIIILDSRFLRHSYGDEVLKSLPPAHVHIGSTRDMIPTLTTWFGPATLKRWQRK